MKDNMKRKMIPVGKLGHIPEHIMWRYKIEPHEICE